MLREEELMRLGLASKRHGTANRNSGKIGKIRTTFMEMHQSES